MAIDERVEVGEVEQPPLLGAAHRGAQARGGERGGEVEQRARGGRDRQAVQCGDVAGREHAAAMQPHAARRLPPAEADEHVEPRAAAAQDPPRGARAVVAQRGAGAAGEHGGPAAPGDGEAAMPDGVDAAVDRMQPPRLHAPRDAAARQPRIEELRDADDAALPRGDRRDPLLRCVLVRIPPHSRNATELAPSMPQFLTL